jgi:hypothetical protein
LAGRKFPRINHGNLKSKRPYKEAWSFEKAMEIMEEEKGLHFDPLLLDTFISIAKPLYDRFGGKEEIPLVKSSRNIFMREWIAWSTEFLVLNYFKRRLL